MAISGGDGSIILTTKIDESGLNDGLKSLRKGVSNFEKALKGVAVAGAGAFVAVGTAAIKAYADFEQLKGGVETLFKDSADVLMRYADNAYQTAGLSANDYMETVTSFSASLLQSLGGDTEKAANYADQAIIDMSDNANKMGTSMEMIQNAYQGFAKQNYTMLDNLKLGYGGTKEEMQRLLDDAEKISGIKYDISSFVDITQAIHVIQTELGITGTTALEASSTIQGSISSMKAAWVNLLVAFANPEQDLSVAIDNLKNSLSAVADNLLPRIGEAFGSIFGSIPTPILAVASAIGAVVAGITAYNAVMKVKNVLDAIQEAGSIKLALAQIGLNTAMLASPITWVVAGITALVAAFVLLWNKCEGFRNFWIGLWELLKGTLTSIWEEHIKPFWEEHLQPAIQAIMDKLTELWEVVIKPIIDKTVTILKDLWNNVLKPIVDWLVSFFVERFKFAFDTIKSVIQTAKEIIATVIDSIKNIFIGIIDFIIGVFTGDWKKAWEGVASVFKGIWDGIWGVAKGIINLIIGALNAFVAGINKIKFDVPEWVPVIGGKQWGFNIPKIPKLAQGAVIPPNREFLAVLGDQKHGTNIEAPLQTIVDAFNIALQSNSNYGGGNTEVVLEIDGREFGRAVVEQGNRENRRIGTRLVIA